MELETKQRTKSIGRLAGPLGALGLGVLFAAAAATGELRPFGVAYCAASAHPALAALGAFCRYVLGGGENGLLYGAACGVVLTCRLVLEGTAVARWRGFFPLCAMIALISTGLVQVEVGADLLTLGGQALLCGGFALLLGEARDGKSPLMPWGRLAALLAGLLAWLPLTLWGLRPARLLAVGVVEVISCCCGGTVGALAGAAFGAAMDLALGQSPFFALLWCASAPVAGAFGRRERLTAALHFSILTGLLCLWLYQREGAGAAFYESLLAGAIMTLLPGKLWLRVETGCAALSSEPVLPVMCGGGQALRGLSQALAGLGQAMVPDTPAGPPELLGPVFRSGCELACRSCPRFSQCWQRDYESMRDVLCHLAQPLRSRHALQLSDLPPWFAGSCLSPERFCGSINDACRAALRREARLRQEREGQARLGRQYARLGALLESAAVQTGTGTLYDARLEGQVRRIVRAYLPGAKAAVCLTGGRLQADIRLKQPSSQAMEDCDALRRSLQGALQMTLLPPERVESASGTVIRLRQQERCVLLLSPARRKKTGETLCGDEYRALHTDDGRAAVLLSDGMGTGEAAGVCSRQALELLCSFVRSGCGLGESVAAVLPVLAARFPQWGFVTLDLLEVNLFSGGCNLLKYGAAPSFLLREGRLTRFDGSALPAGLAEDGEAAPIRLRLSPGDRVILLSDGAFLEDRTAALLREQGTLEGSALAGLLLEEAARAGSGDDMTVLVADFQQAEAV